MQLILTTTSNLLVYVLPPSLRCREEGRGKDGKEDSLPVPPNILPELTLVKTIDIPPISGIPIGAIATFRAARCV